MRIETLLDRDFPSPCAMRRAHPASRCRVDRGKLVEFAAALQLRDPIHFDVAAAISAGYRDLVAPLGFLSAFALQSRGDRLRTFGIDADRALVGERRSQQFEVVCAGDELLVESVLLDVGTKYSPRSMQALTVETRLRNQFDRTVLVCTELILELERSKSTQYYLPSDLTVARRKGGAIPS